MIRVEQADIWVNDRFLELGLEVLFADETLVNRRLRFVFFTIDHYFNVKAQNYNLSTHRVVFLTQGPGYNFLNDLNMYRIDTRSDLDDIRRFIVELSCDLDKREPLKSVGVRLTLRDRLIIEQLSVGVNVSEIANINQIHYKTVCQIRQDLIRKLGCENQVELMEILRSDVFKRWVLNNAT